MWHVRNRKQSREQKNNNNNNLFKSIKNHLKKIKWQKFKRGEREIYRRSRHNSLCRFYIVSGFFPLLVIKNNDEFQMKANLHVLFLWVTKRPVSKIVKLYIHSIGCVIRDIWNFFFFVVSMVMEQRVEDKISRFKQPGNAMKYMI